MELQKERFVIERYSFENKSNNFYSCFYMKLFIHKNIVFISSIAFSIKKNSVCIQGGTKFLVQTARLSVSDHGEQEFYRNCGSENAIMMVQLYYGRDAKKK